MTTFIMSFFANFCRRQQLSKRDTTIPLVPVPVSVNDLNCRGVLSMWSSLFTRGGKHHCMNDESVCPLCVRKKLRSSMKFSAYAHDARDFSQLCSE